MSNFVSNHPGQSLLVGGGILGGAVTITTFLTLAEQGKISAQDFDNFAFGDYLSNLSSEEKAWIGIGIAVLLLAIASGVGFAVYNSKKDKYRYRAANFISTDEKNPVRVSTHNSFNEKDERESDSKVETSITIMARLDPDKYDSNAIYSYDQYKTLNDALHGILACPKIVIVRYETTKNYTTQTEDLAFRVFTKENNREFYVQLLKLKDKNIGYTKDNLEKIGEERIYKDVKSLEKVINDKSLLEESQKIALSERYKNTKSSEDPKNEEKHNKEDESLISTNTTKPVSIKSLYIYNEEDKAWEKTEGPWLQDLLPKTNNVSKDFSVTYDNDQELYFEVTRYSAKKYEIRRYEFDKNQRKKYIDNENFPLKYQSAHAAWKNVQSGALLPPTHQVTKLRLSQDIQIEHH